MKIRLFTLAAFVTASMTSGNALAFKSEACIFLIHEAISNADTHLSKPSQQLELALDRTKVSSKSVQYYEASLLYEAVTATQLGFQLMGTTSFLAQALQNDEARHRRWLLHVDSLSQKYIEVLQLNIKQVKLQLSDINDRELRQASIEVAKGMMNLANLYAPCKKD